MLPATTLVINISSVALIWFGGLRIDAGHMQVGSLIAFLAYFMQILMAVLMATVLAVMLPRASVCAERVSGVLGTRPRVTSPPDPVRPVSVTGEIVFDDASFSYPGADRPVLQQVSLRVRRGTTTAVVGSTGSGKSTLLAMICRFYDVTAGAVRIDGVDVRDLDLEQLWSSIGLVPSGATCSPGRLPKTCATGPRPDRNSPPNRCGTHCGLRPPTTSSLPTPTGWTARWPRVASISPADSDNGSRSRER